MPKEEPIGTAMERSLGMDAADPLESERQLAQDRKMEAIGRLAAGVAHDFNNLLTAIIGYSNLALMKVGENDRTREDLAQIKQAGERAAQLTQQLLALSRKQMLSPTVVDLASMTRKMENRLRQLLGEKVELLTVCDPSLKPVKADLGQIEQVLMNLAMNARDAMPCGGKLMVEMRNRVFGPEPGPEDAIAPGEYVLLCVSDTGSGMDGEIRSHLFEPFFTTKTPARGAGLGLATVYGIVRQSGGHVRVQSEPGRGTVFSIYLPATRENPSRSASGDAGVPGPATRGDETILVAEDEPAVRGFLREALEHNGYRVLEANDGEAALEKAAEAASRGGTLPGNEGEIRLLVTDMVMGAMNGRELADEVTGLLPGVKVLYISGYADRAAIREGVVGKGLAFLRKPFTPAELARKVRSMLDAK